MRARAGMIWMALALVSAAVVFTLKYEVRDLRESLAALEAETAGSRETARVLRAEWSYLSRLGRLSELAERHLDLEPVTAGQLGHIADIPLRSEPESDVAALPDGSALVALELGQP